MNNTAIKEKTLETGHGKIYYYTAGNFTDRPTVVFLHGLSSNHTTWLNIMNIFLENKYNVVAWDMRGHGLSDKTKKRSLYTMSEFTRDIKLILDKEDLGKIILVGYSYGGSIAINFTIRHPQHIQNLILISANHANPFVYWKIGFLSPIAYWFLYTLSMLLLWQSRKKYYYYRHGQHRGGYWRATWQGLNTMPISVNFWMLMQMRNVDFRETISAIHVPTLIIRAQNDPFLTKKEADDMLKEIRNSRIVVPEHNSHFLATRAQEEVADIILGFIQKQ